MGRNPQKLGFRVGEEDDGFSHVGTKRIYCVWALYLGLRPLTLDNGLQMVILRPGRTYLTYFEFWFGYQTFNHIRIFCITVGIRFQFFGSHYKEFDLG